MSDTPEDAAGPTYPPPDSGKDSSNELLLQALEHRLGYSREQLDQYADAFVSTLDATRGRVAELERRVQELEASDNQFVVRLTQRLFPPGSGRRRFVGRTVWALRTLRSEGPAALARAFYRRFQVRWPSSVASIDPSADLALPQQAVCELSAGATQRVQAGRADVAYLEGTCFHASKALRSLEARIGGAVCPIGDHSLANPRRPDASGPWLSSRALLSGFRGILDLPPLPVGSHPIEVVATFEGGGQSHHQVGVVEAVAPAVPDGPSCRVAVCLATYNPDPELFRAQIESLRGQALTDWHCWVSDDASEPTALAAVRSVLSDDPRFTLLAHDERLGYFHNFERALEAVPAGVEFVALCDQDDRWHADKLQACVDALRDGATLAYSDMRLVDRTGKVVSTTYWKGRTNNHRSLEALLLANTVTGASMMVRRSLLDVALPFPPKLLSEYHDHWLAVCAAAVGELAYIPRPLYDYTQHTAQVVGQWNTQTHSLWETYRSYREWRRSPFAAKVSTISPIACVVELGWWIRRATLWCRKLEVRGAHHPGLAHFRGSTGSPGAAFRLGLSLRGLKGATLGAHWIAWTSLLAERLLQRTFTEHRLRIAAIPAGGTAALEAPAPESHGLEAAYGNVRFIQKKIQPLDVRVSPAEPPRVNLVTSTIDFRYFFGGYFAVFSLALALDDAGYRVRLVLTDPVDHKPDLWRTEIKRYAGLERFFDRVEVAPCYERPPLACSPSDQFIASSWWTAFIAHRAAQAVGRERFIYLSQDFEPLFHAANAFYALALESYSLPHYALYSTEFLRWYAQSHRLGPFTEGDEQGLANSTSFQNAIEGSIRPQLPRERPRKKLLVYARPEEHANRNCFPLAVLALHYAIDRGAFDPREWDIEGIGAVDIFGPMQLAGGRTLKLLKKVPLDAYNRLLSDYDLGLSLMLTPHPSLVPLDMAAAGLVTVTNTFDIKTAERIEAISPNLIAAEPTIESIGEALLRAAERVDDQPARVEGSRIRWARSWQESFAADVVQKLAGWIPHPPRERRP